MAGYPVRSRYETAPADGNEWTGARSFSGHSLHFISQVSKNPYQAVISVILRTLSSFDEDRVIPAYGFGDMQTQDRDVFPLNPTGAPCHGFEEVLHFYSLQAQQRRLSGPTSFAPLISRAVQIVRERRTYHILVIIADGQVEDGGATVAAIVQASEYPLSIVMVGVGDGPWDLMRAFDDELPQRAFDNFQFVPFTAHMTEPAFALAALQEIPQQYSAICKLGLLERLRKSARVPSSSPEVMPHHAYPHGMPFGGSGVGAYSQAYAPSAPPPPM
eukprot:jgi/Mesvir1/28011/Mv20200-RA.1